MAIGNLILAIVAIVWGLYVLKSRRKWFPILLLIIGVGWLVKAIVMLTSHQQLYDSRWKSYNPGNPGQWQVNNDKYVTDSDTEFKWTIYVGTKSNLPDFTDWTTHTSWKLISSEEAKTELGMMWRLVPQNHHYFYALSMPQSAWYVPGTPATMVGVYTSIQNASDGKRLVEDVIYRSATDAPILLATTPMQLTSITTNQAEQSITFTWNPLP